MNFTSTVMCDEYTDHISKNYDFEFDGINRLSIPSLPSVPDVFGIGVIYGSSGSGKSSLLSQFGVEEHVTWDSRKSIASHFPTPEDAVEKMSAVGLNSIPTWTRPYHVLSTGEKFRARLARVIGDGIVIDEYTSVVNRSVAKTASLALRKMVTRNNLQNIVIATCHDDVLDWLEPEWTYNTDTCVMSVGRGHRRPVIHLEVFKADYGLWGAFERHHYLSATLNKASSCFRAVMDGVTVGFNASLPLTGRIPPLYSGDSRNRYRESRTVILPDYQGVGIGTRFSDAISEIWLSRNYRYFSKTAHVRMGRYREASDLWRPTSTNLVSRAKSKERSDKKEWNHLSLDIRRICFSHEYVGSVGTIHRDLWEKHKEIKP
jgi:ABC-type lipoprotein export system ATPase subunit/GNAT superfamily N-acetyltransferase